MFITLNYFCLTGEARATVIPCYKFTQCPPKVKTVYNKEIAQEKKDSSDKKTEQTDNGNSKKTELIPSVAKNNERTSQPQKDGEKQTNVANPVSDKAKKDGNENSVPNKAEVTKKPDRAEKPVTTKPITANKCDVVKNSNDKSITSNPAASKPVKASTANKSDGVIKPNTTTTQNSREKPIASKRIIKANTMAKKKELSAQNKEKKPPNDYDELDDEDILALISDGIVLDQCSGSDDE